MAVTHAQQGQHAHSQQSHSFHPLPVIGHPKAWYERHVKAAEQHGDVHARASHKVGIHITEALDPAMPWAEKLRHFCHALTHHCVAPPDADESLKAFYHKLGDIVRRYASQEAVRLVRQQHERYFKRLRNGASRDELADEADGFFPAFVGHTHDCPDWYTPEAFNQIRQIESEWI